MSKISVIVPVYNVENYVSTCLASILKQTYTDLEILAIDDGSTDNSLQIIQELAQKDDRIRVITKENSGVSSTRNLGLREATGDYIAFVDSDDYLDVDCFEHLFDLIIQDDSDISSIGFRKVYSDKTLDYPGRSIVLEKDEILKQYLLGADITCYVFGKLYKKQVVEDVFFNEQFTFSEDVLYLYHVLKNVRRVSVANDLVKYNYNKMNETSLVSQTVSEKNIDTLKVGEVIFQDAKSDKHVAPYAELFKIANNCGFVEMVIDSNSELLQDVKQEALSEIKKYSLWKNRKYLTRRKMIRIGMMKFSPRVYSIVRALTLKLEKKGV